MKYIINTDDLYGGDIYKSMLLMGTNGKGEVIVQKFNLDELEELNSDYINEHYGSLQDDAYQRGLDDAWEAARKIVLDRNEGGTSIDELTEIFGSCTIQQVFRRYTVSKAIEKLKAYEEKAENEIKVGDEVVWTEDENVVIVVTRVYTVDGFEWCDGVCRDGKVYHILTEHARKTGRRFDIDKILEEMRE